MSGYLDITVGPMYSGKTEKLIQIYNYLKPDEKVLTVNHKLDSGHRQDKLVSHNGNEVPCISIDDLSTSWYDEKSPHYDTLHEHDYILINEAQFFDNLYETITDMLRDRKKIFLYGLDGDYKQEKFGEILDLVPLCDHIEKLKSPCMYCGGIAIFTHRTSNATDQIIVGPDHYETICRLCLTKYNIHIINEVAKVD